jgi:hypothetical protein
MPAIDVRRMNFAGSILDIAYDDPLCAHLIEYLFADVPGETNPAKSEQAPDFRYLLEIDQSGEKFNLFNGTEFESQHSERGDISLQLVSQACYRLAYFSTGGLLLHAGLVSRDGLGIILPGTTGKGKSTLTAWLITRGYDYLSDELVYIPQGSTEAFGFSRPLNLKRSAGKLITDRLGLTINNPEIISNGYVNFIPPRLLGNINVPRSVELGLIIFPEYQADSGFEVGQLTKAQTGLGMMRCLINARNLPDHGFKETTRIARRFPAHSIIYDRFDPVDKFLDQILEMIG